MTTTTIITIAAEQLFTINFDSKKTTKEEILADCEKHNFKPLLITHSTSQKNIIKVTFAFESPIFSFDSSFLSSSSEKMKNLVYTTITKLIGGKPALEKQEQNQIQETEIENIITFESLYFSLNNDLNKSSQKARDQKIWIEKSGIETYDKSPLIMFGIFEKVFKIIDQEYIYQSPRFNDNLNHNYDHYTIIFKNEIETEESKKEKYNFLDVKEKKVVDIKELKENCYLMEAAALKDHELTEKETIGLASNLTKIKGGKTAYDNLSDNKIIYNQINSEHYAPINCCNYCPYHNTCDNNSQNLVYRLTNDNNTVSQIKEIEYRDINDIYNDMRSDLEKIINSEDESGLYLVKAPTGAGKTSAIIDILNHTDNTITLALPTHKLKTEVYNKMTAAGIDAINILPQPEIQDKDLKHKIDFLNSIGASSMVQGIFRNILSSDFSKNKYKNDYENISEYVKSIDESTHLKKNILITHQRALFATTKNDILVIDEDILLKAIVGIDTVSFIDLMILMDELENKIKEILKSEKISDKKREDYLDALVYLNGFNKYTVSEIKQSEKNKTIKSFFSCDVIKVLISAADGLYNDMQLSKMTNIFKFLESDYFIINSKYEISYSNLNTIKQDYKKIIIMSATFSENLYRKVFSNYDVKVKNYGTAKPYNRLQITNKSFSRSQFLKDEKLSDLAKNLINEYNPGSETITYKSLSESPDDVWYGATEGIDKYAGLDVSVVGTPHMAQEAYSLVYSTIHGKEIEKQEMSYQKVKNEYYEFWLTSFENQYLREIQMYMIESEIEQAVGRSRDLRHNCKTLILSNYPSFSSSFLQLSKKELQSYK